MELLSRILAALLLAYLVLLEPVLGVRLYRGFLRRLAVDAAARRRYYRMIIAWEWSWMAIVVLIMLPVPHSLAAIGLVNPNSIGWGLGTGILVGLLISTAAFSSNAQMQDWFRRMLSGVEALLPATRIERWLYAGVSVSAGVCEELVFRGFVRFYLQGFGVPILLIVLLSALIFGMAHWYQGWKGAAQTALLGAVLMALYVLSNSLVPCVVFHALVDLRILLIYRGPGGSGGTIVSGADKAS